MVCDWLVGIDHQMRYFKAGEDNDITVSIDNFNEFSHWILQVENFSEFPILAMPTGKVPKVPNTKGCCQVDLQISDHFLITTRIGFPLNN